MTILPLVSQLAEQLVTKEYKLSLAESCTGGAIAAACTSLAGSSAWFEAGVVSYSNAAKTSCLDVPEAVLAEFGAVSREVVEAMATGAASRFGCQVAIATSGVAGPGGGSAEKPVGTVWIATSLCGEVFAQCHHFSGDRAAVQASALEKSLQTLLQRLTV